MTRLLVDQFNMSRNPLLSEDPREVKFESQGTSCAQVYTGLYRNFHARTYGKGKNEYK